jgi:hypothetical protein
MTDPNYELAKLVGAMWIHLPQHEENINHPEFGRHTYINGITYETVQYNKCVAALLKELVRQYSTSLPPDSNMDEFYARMHGGESVIYVDDILKVIEELEG